MAPMIFGGSFFSELDLCAAACVNRFLHDSDCQEAVTHKSNVTFLLPTYVGDIIFMKSVISSVGGKFIVVDVVAEREKRDGPNRDQVAIANFVFVSIEHAKDVYEKPHKLPYKDHGLSL